MSEEQVRVEASCTWMSSGGLLLALGLGSLSAVGLVLATKTIPLQTMEKALGGVVTMSLCLSLSAKELSRRNSDNHLRGVHVARDVS